MNGQGLRTEMARCVVNVNQGHGATGQQVEKGAEKSQCASPFPHALTCRAHVQTEARGLSVHGAHCYFWVSLKENSRGW